MSSLRLRPDILRTILQHARRERPRECCGFLVGSRRQVLYTLPMPNVAASPLTRFRIDDRAHLEIRRTLRALSPPLEILGVYHSHPKGEAKPSDVDLSESHYPEWVYLIVGLRRPSTIRAFRIARGRAREIQFDADRS